MQGFEEATILLPSTDGLGYTGEKKVEPKLEPKSVSALLDPSTADLGAIRAEKRRREIEAMSTTRRAEDMPTEFFSKEDAGDLDAAVARKDAGAGSGVRVSLREQLRLNKEASEAAWQEKHNPFKPPPGLSEEEYQIYAEMEEERLRRRESDRERAREDELIFELARKEREDAEAARLALKERNPNANPLATMLDPALSFSNPSPGDALVAHTNDSHTNHDSIPSSTTAAALLPPVTPLVVLKRKHKDKESKKEMKKHKKHKKDNSESTPESAAPSSTPPGSLTTSATAMSSSSTEPAATSALAGLAAYSSDDE